MYLNGLFEVMFKVKKKNMFSLPDIYNIPKGSYPGVSNSKP